MKLKEKGILINELFMFDLNFAGKFTNYYFIGIDEVGRGALAGPVIACAFCWKFSIEEIVKRHYKSPLHKLNDSKQLSKVEREELYHHLVKLGNFSLGYGTIQEIEKLNILNATYLAMKRAFESLISCLNKKNLNPYVLIDGNKFNPYINCRQSCIVDGDAKSSVIAGASVIAKVYRDRLMHKISKIKKYKRFGWLTNVGYGTSFHTRAIKRYGITPLHRKLFVRNVFNDE